MCVISKRTSSYIFQITTQLDKRLYTLIDLGLFWYYYYKLNLKKFFLKMEPALTFTIWKEMAAFILSF